MAKKENEPRPPKPADPSCGKCFYQWVPNRGWILSINLNCPEAWNHR
jgi:hypothetical protein